jgi:hypothetical protein
MKLLNDKSCTGFAIALMVCAAVVVLGTVMLASLPQLSLSWSVGVVGQFLVALTLAVLAMSLRWYPITERDLLYAAKNAYEKKRRVKKERGQWIYVKYLFKELSRRNKILYILAMLVCAGIVVYGVRDFLGHFPDLVYRGTVVSHYVSGAFSFALGVALAALVHDCIMRDVVDRWEAMRLELFRQLKIT